MHRKQSAANTRVELLGISYNILCILGLLANV